MVTLKKFKEQIKDMPDDMILTVETPRMLGNNGNLVMYTAYDRDKKYLAINCKADMDIGTELEARFEYAAKNQLDELDFYMELLDDGYTLKDFAYDEERYKYAKNFMEEHGLLNEADESRYPVHRKNMVDSHVKSSTVVRFVDADVDGCGTDVETFVVFYGNVDTIKMEEAIAKYKSENPGKWDTDGCIEAALKTTDAEYEVMLYDASVIF